MPTKSELALAAAAEALAEAGYVPDGQTRSEHFRVGSAAAPVYGGLGGKVASSGGRQRFRRGDSDDWATAGPVTVALYERPNGGAPANMRTVPTKDLEALREALGLPARAPAP